MSRLLKRLRADEGFTLIELLIVIIILGILAAIVIFGVTAFRGQAVTEACNTDKKQVETAAAAYLAKEGDSATGDGTLLVTGGYLQDFPSSDDYTITYTKDGADGYTVGPANCP